MNEPCRFTCCVTEGNREWSHLQSSHFRSYIFMKEFVRVELCGGYWRPYVTFSFKGVQIITGTYHGYIFSYWMLDSLSM